MRIVAGISAAVHLLLAVVSTGTLLYTLATSNLLEPGPHRGLVIGLIVGRVIGIVVLFGVATALYSAADSDSGHKGPPSLVASFFIGLAAFIAVPLGLLLVASVALRFLAPAQEPGKPDSIAGGKQPPAVAAPDRAANATARNNQPQEANQTSKQAMPENAAEKVARLDPQAAAQIDAKVEAAPIPDRFGDWIASAGSLAKELAQVTAESARNRAALHRVEITARMLKAKRELVLPTGSGSPGDSLKQVSMLPDPVRQQLLAANEELIREQKRLSALASPEIKNSRLLASLDSAVLPAWLVEGRSPSAEEISAIATVATKSELARSIEKKRRNYREDASWAMTFSRSQDAVAMLRADLLTHDDRAILDGVKWSPALKRPLMLVQWAYGAEMNGQGDSGPANLHPKGAAPPRQDRNKANDHRLAQQLKTLTGDIGNWLTLGLQTRVEAGSFGDWGPDSRRTPFEHRGVTLLEVAPVEILIESARAERADALMCFSLTSNRISNGKATTTAIVQLYDVTTGEKLWESKPISNAKLLSARRQGKDLAAGFAETVLEFIDDEIVLREVPELTSVQAKQRLKAIAAGLEKDPLASLVELRYLELSGLVAKTTARKGMAKILGAEDAERLVSEDEQLRRQSIEKLVPNR